MLPQLTDKELDELAVNFGPKHYNNYEFDHRGYADALIHLLLKKFEERGEDLSHPS